MTAQRDNLRRDAGVALFSMLARAMLLRCPRCGGRGILRTWFALKESCPTCGQLFDRGETDHWLGAYAINLVVAEGIPLVVALVLLVAYWPETTPALVVGVAMVILCPIAFFPFSRTLWLALDLKLRPDSSLR